jgi:hypothetical protein
MFGFERLQIQAGGTWRAESFRLPNAVAITVGHDPTVEHVRRVELGCRHDRLNAHAYSAVARQVSEITALGVLGSRS